MGGKNGSDCLVCLGCGCPAFVEVRLIQWLSYFAFLLFWLNPNICLWIFIIRATVFTFLVGSYADDLQVPGTVSVGVKALVGTALFFHVQ